MREHDIYGLKKLEIQADEWDWEKEPNAEVIKATIKLAIHHLHVGKQYAQLLANHYDYWYLQDKFPGLGGGREVNEEVSREIVWLEGLYRELFPEPDDPDIPY